MSTWGRIVRAALLICAALWGTAFADGSVILDFDGNTPDPLQRMRVAPDGRIYVLLYTPVCAILAFDPDGTLIGTFGSGGRVIPTLCPAWDLVVKADGSILTLESSAGPRVVGRDISGAVQFVTDPPAQAPGSQSDIVLGVHPDGRMLVGGNVSQGEPRSITTDWAVRRFNVQGSVDYSFANGVLIKDAGNPGNERVHALHGLADGRVLVSGSTAGYGVIARVNSDGSADGTFGSSGQVPLLSGGGDRFVSDSTGRIYILAGERHVTRLSADGMLDTSYAGGAPANDSWGDHSIALDSMERAVVTGVHLVLPQPRTAFIKRFTTAGAPDTSLAGTGGVEIALPNLTGIDPVSCDGAPQSDDKIILACSHAFEVAPGVKGDPDLIISRYNVDGTLDTTFGQAQPDSDTYPDAFTFAEKTAPFGTAYVEADPITITGINSKAAVSIQTLNVSGIAQLSVGCTGTYTAGGTILPGQTLCVRTQSSNFPLGTFTSSVRVGARSAIFTVRATAEQADVTPNAFTFVDQTNLAVATEATSNTIQITGIAGAAPLSVTGGDYSIGCDSNPYSFTRTPTHVTNGTLVCVRHTSGAQPATTVATTLTVGGVSDTFTTTTIPADGTPDPFTFPSQTGVPIGGTVVSADIIIGGFNVAVPVSVTGGMYSIGCNHPFTDQPGQLPAGQRICVQHTAAAQGNTSMTTTLTVGGVVGTFTSTTAAASNDSSGRRGGGGGAIDLFSLLQLAGMLLLIAVARSRRARRPF
jgi:uncharacterized delta-60 repeat protein